jgi:DNA-binding transcriptional MerR regulator
VHTSGLRPRPAQRLGFSLAEVAELLETYINGHVTTHLTEGQPVVSVDAKKKELKGRLVEIHDVYDDLRRPVRIPRASPW